MLIEKYEAISVDDGEPDYIEKMMNLKDESGIHPLFLAVFQGNTEVTKIMLQQGADPMIASDPNGVTLLHICAERGYSEIAKMICQAAPTLIFQSDADGNTALHVVCDWDYIEILKTFCDCIDSQIEQSKTQENLSASEERKPLTAAGGSQKKKLKSPMKVQNKQGLTPVELAYEENT